MWIISLSKGLNQRGNKVSTRRRKNRKEREIRTGGVGGGGDGVSYLAQIEVWVVLFPIVNKDIPT